MTQKDAPKSEDEKAGAQTGPAPDTRRPNLAPVPDSADAASDDAGATPPETGAGAAGSQPSPAPAPPPVDVAAELATWALALAPWQRHLVAKLLVKESLTDSERTDAYALVVEAAGGPASGVSALPLARHDFPASAPAADAPRLIGLGPLRNVNAVADGERLRFEPDGLTIVFGKNAAGKSSYVRPLKRLCRSVHRESEILPNVFAPVRSSAAPTAQVETRHAPASGTVAQEYKLSVGTQSPLASMSVFDSRCASVYVSNENEVAFIPSLLAVLDRLADELNAIKQIAEASREALLAKRARLPAVPTATSAASFLSQVSARTTDVELAAAARALDEGEVRCRDELQLVVSPAAREERQRRRATLLSEAHGAEELINRLDALARAVGDEAAGHLATLQAQAKTARAAAELAAREAFELKTLPGVGSTPWQGLWEAARLFFEAEVSPAGAFPPTAEGDACPLCFQELSPEARGRFEHFEQFVKGTTEAEARRASTKLAQARDVLRPELVAACRTPAFDVLAKSEPAAHAELARWLGQAEQRLNALKCLGDDAEGSDRATSESGVEAATKDALALAPCPNAFVREFAERRRAEIATIDAATDPQELAKLQSELDELRGREVLAAHAAQLRQHVKSLRDETVITNVISRLSTRQISMKQRELSERVVTDALAARLRRELHSLDVGHVAITLDQRARSGVMLLKLRLAATSAHAPDDVLSEGERKALALAFFLAEVGEPGHDGGAVFDDPVSSFDYERKEAIAERLAQEAAKRQVIVFTHDVSFLVRLRHHAEVAGVGLACQTVWRSGNLIGRTSDDVPFGEMKLKARLGKLSDELQNMRIEDFRSPDEHRRAVSSWYEGLRRTWERLVEEVVLAGVVERFSPAIQTQKLKAVRWSDDIVERVDRGMTRASAWVHDQPAAENATLPTKQDMARDLDEISDLVKELRQKN